MSGEKYCFSPHKLTRLSSLFLCLGHLSKAPALATRAGRNGSQVRAKPPLPCLTTTWNSTSLMM